ncbi:MAG: Rpp14/Pop5 family protein [Candidatus Micrarchaeota archaeon]
MRTKKRYLLYKVEGQQLDEKSARLAVRNAVYAFLGEKGASEANVKFMGFDSAKQLFFLRCALESLESTIAAIALQTAFNAKPLALRLEKMSGSVKNVWD